MNGAEVLTATLTQGGVDTVFMNPGTTELDLVDTFTSVPGMRCVLTLFEGVASGAADGFGRIAGYPAATLLHLGPGLANAAANFHNARRARTPVISIVGEHTRAHQPLDPPLASDIAGIAKTHSKFVEAITSSDQICTAVATALATATTAPKGVATLLFPADLAWEPSRQSGEHLAASRSWTPDTEALKRAATALVRPGAVIFAGGDALRKPALNELAKLCSRGAQIFAETFPAVHERGGNLPRISRLPYLPEQAIALLERATALILIGAPQPISFFGYRGTPSILTPSGCEIIEVVPPGFPCLGAIEALAEEAGLSDPYLPPVPTEPMLQAQQSHLDAVGLASAIASSIESGTIVVDEANTGGVALQGPTSDSPEHIWLTVPGGSIGEGIPLAIGAALAEPNSRVLALVADGSSLYTIQGLWTIARERLPVTVVILNNLRYAILQYEASRRSPVTEELRKLTSLDSPAINYRKLAEGFGIKADVAHTPFELLQQLHGAALRPEPVLIEAELF